MNVDDAVIYRLAFRSETNKKPKDIFLDCLTELFYEAEFEESIKNDEISEKIKNRYGLNIPSIVVNKWIKERYQYNSETKTYLPKDRSTEDIEKWAEERKDKEKSFADSVDELSKIFIEYAQEKFNRNINKEDAKKIFSAYRFLQFYSVDSVDAVNTAKIDFNDNDTVLQYFVKEKCLQDERKTAVLDNLGIANQLTWITLGEDIDRKKFLKDCHFYLDTPLLMRMFGYDGREISDLPLRRIKNSGTNYTHASSIWKKPGMMVSRSLSPYIPSLKKYYSSSINGVRMISILMLQSCKHLMTTGKH